MDKLGRYTIQLQELRPDGEWIAWLGGNHVDLPALEFFAKAGSKAVKGLLKLMKEEGVL